MWYKSRFYEITCGIILILLIIFLALQIRSVFDFIFAFISAILFPCVIALVFYYLLRPLRNFLESKKTPRYIALLFIFIMIAVAISVLVNFIWPYVVQQIGEFTLTPATKIKEVEKKTVDFMNLFNFTALSREDLTEYLIYYTKQFMNWLTTDIVTVFTSVFSSLTQIASYFIITPFLLFYLLKDDREIYLEFHDLVPRKYVKSATRLFNEIDDTMSSYIAGQVTVACIVGVLIFIGYKLIGLKYAALLALIALVFNLIPFCGPFISTIPALLIGLSHSPLMGFKVICVVLTVHLLDLNLISPKVVGPRLQIHPVTIILLLVASFSVIGFLGLFFVIPLYAVAKVIINDIYETKFARPQT